MYLMNPKEYERRCRVLEEAYKKYLSLRGSGKTALDAASEAIMKEMRAKEAYYEARYRVFGDASREDYPND